MRRLPYTFEPLRAVRSTTWNIPYRSGPPRVDDPDSAAKWHGDRDRAERNAPVLIFGSAAFDPMICTLMDGTPSIHSGEAIVGSIAPFTHDHPKGADHVGFADRVVACVNALAGIKDPEGTILAVRTLLWAAYDRDRQGADPKLVALLGRLGPDQEYAAHQKRVSSPEEP